MEKNVQFYVPAALLLEEVSPVPIEWVAGWVVDIFEKGKEFLIMSEVEPPFLCCAVRILFPVTSMLSKLIPFAVAERCFSSLQALESIQANDCGWKRSGCEGCHLQCSIEIKMALVFFSENRRQRGSLWFCCEAQTCLAMQPLLRF